MNNFHDALFSILFDLQLSSINISQPCGTGELDGGPAHAQNFFGVIKTMKFLL